MTVKQAAKKFGVSEVLIYRWVQDGRIKSSFESGHVEIADDATRPAQKRSGRKFVGLINEEPQSNA